MPLCVIVVATLLFAANASAASADQSREEWLRGSGSNLHLCLHGEVFESDGQPATDFQVTGHMDGTVSNQPIKPSVDGHRFELWIPVNQPHWYSIWLIASSANGDRVAYKAFNAYQLRQAANDGIRLTLQPPTRHVTIKVTDRGQVVGGAMVKAELEFGIDLRSTTNANGTARFGLLPQQRLSGLTAWTGDHRVGGFSFNRKPPRDPDADEQVIELSKCRDQKMRFIAEDGSPVPGVNFAIQIATPSPNYNYIGTNDHSQMTTDAAGEAVYRWFPDWEKVHFNAEINENPWVLNGDAKIVDGVAVVNLKKSKPRKHITGRIVSTGTSAGGFFASLWSFQGEREHHSDVISAFSNADGTFAIDVLPDATYCAFVLDNRWVGNIIDLTPYESASNKSTPPELTVSEGQPVQVMVTTGPRKKPFPNLTISFRREYEYSWLENGEKHQGIGGPQWGATTDESGIANTRTLPGKMQVSVYTPRWRAEQTMTVAADKPAMIMLHRETEEKRTVTGRLVLDQGVPESLRAAEIRIGSTDGNYEDQQSPTCGPDGSFSFDTFASSIGVFARTRDGQAAGSKVTRDLTSLIEVHLRPTSNYVGQLLGKDNRPAVGHSVRAIVRVEGEKNRDSRHPESFQAERIEATTDEQGNFTLRGIPSQMKVSLSADAIDGSDDSVYLGEIYLEPNELRPPSVSRLGKTTSAPTRIPLAERYQSTLRDCALSGYRLMLVIADDIETVTEFVNQNYVSDDTNKDVSSFMQIVVRATKGLLEPADAAFLQERNWPLPQPGHVTAYAIDAGGMELGRQNIKVNRYEAVEQVANFIHEHAPAPLDAEEKWTAAFVEAGRSNRRVWVRVSQRYCAPCFRMTRWLDDQRRLLEKDYVMLKIDDVRDKNGKEVAQRVVRGEQFSIPFHAIFDASGTMLIDSIGPLGNIGSPSGFEGKKHLRKMLFGTRQNLIDAEIEQLVESTGY
jgi:hypothetical protein